VIPHEWTPLLLLALGSQVIGQGLLVYAIGHLSPVVVGVGLLTQPVAASALGWLIYRESFTLADLAGALLIAAAMVVIRSPARTLASKRAEDH
jgi:drug/metabolite transporter (DMT)-like permease